MAILDQKCLDPCQKNEKNPRSGCKNVKNPCPVEYSKSEIRAKNHEKSEVRVEKSSKSVVRKTYNGPPFRVIKVISDQGAMKIYKCGFLVD